MSDDQPALLSLGPEWYWSRTRLVEELERARLSVALLQAAVAHKQAIIAELEERR